MLAWYTVQVRVHSKRYLIFTLQAPFETWAKERVKEWLDKHNQPYEKVTVQ